MRKLSLNPEAEQGHSGGGGSQYRTDDRRSLTLTHHQLGNS